MDYSHHYHAGNVGDVWKHCALVACLRALRLLPGPRCYVETHAGGGCYELGPTGEWTEGVGQLLAERRPAFPAAVESYLAALRDLGFSPHSRTYPGSPMLGLALLGQRDRAVLVELQESARAALATTLANDRRATIEAGDGLAALLPCLAAQHRGAETLVLIDPPYVAKPEWTLVPDALAEAWHAHPRVHFLLWYPIKSLTRPDAMLKRLRAAQVPATALDLITTPLDLKRNRLNGSGVLFVNPLPQVVLQVAAAGPTIGEACSTHEGRWQTRGMSWH
jgi:23S rRNA (adenine2030-N6)-methyltransferase